jgi:surface antigen
MTKSEHPVEAFEREIISNAKYFTAFVQLAPGQREKYECRSRPEAEAIAQTMANGYGKAVLVYAVDDAGRQALAATIRPQKRTNP